MMKTKVRAAKPQKTSVSAVNTGATGVPPIAITFAELLFPGSFMSEEDEVKVLERNPVKLARERKGCFSIQFYDQVVQQVTVDGLTRSVRGPKRNVSHKYYPDGELFTAAELRKLPGDYDILISNMECNGWKQVVRCRTHNFQPFEPGDVVLNCAPDQATVRSSKPVTETKRPRGKAALKKGGR